MEISFYNSLGCPGDCSGHGVCTSRKVSNTTNMSTAEHVDEEWFCACAAGFQGKGCQIAIETNCKDVIDNDEGISG